MTPFQKLLDLAFVLSVIVGIVSRWKLNRIHASTIRAINQSLFLFRSNLQLALGQPGAQPNQENHSMSKSVDQVLTETLAELALLKPTVDAVVALVATLKSQPVTLTPAQQTAFANVEAAIADMTKEASDALKADLEAPKP